MRKENPRNVSEVKSEEQKDIPKYQTKLSQYLMQQDIFNVAEHATSANNQR